MSILNRKAAPATIHTRVPSYEGNYNTQYEKSDEQKLYELVVSTLLGTDTFYESADKKLLRLEELIERLVLDGKVDFVANLAVYARSTMDVRSFPIVAAVLLAKNVRKYNINYQPLREVISDVIQRADEIVDLYSFALTVFGDKKAVPLAIKKGVGDSFAKFDRYQFAKYNNRTKAVKLSDVLRIVHPKPASNEHSKIFKEIIEDTLRNTETWNAKLVTEGQKSKEEQNKGKVWEELINSKKLGYMAMLRNLRNIFEDTSISTNTKMEVINRIRDPKAVAKSKQFPYRFVSALEATQKLNNPKLQDAIEDALDLSCRNIPVIGKNVWVIADCSGSMYTKRNVVLPNGERRQTYLSPMQQAMLFAGALVKQAAQSEEVEHVALTIFSDYAKNVPVSSKTSIASYIREANNACIGYGTHLDQAIKKYYTLGFNPDTVVVISDMQVADLQQADINILNRIGTKVAINVDAYDNTPVTEFHGWIQLSGFSDKLFNAIRSYYEGTSLINQLKQPYNKGVINHE